LLDDKQSVSDGRVDGVTGRLVALGRVCGVHHTYGGVIDEHTRELSGGVQIDHAPGLPDQVVGTAQGIDHALSGNSS
jgi:hypothetical protein